MKEQLYTRTERGLKKSERQEAFPELSVSGLFSYTIKSCRGTLLSSAEIVPRGIKGDRELAVRLKSTGEAMTQREFPKLARILPTVLSEDTLLLQAPTMPDVPDLAVTMSEKGTLLNTTMTIAKDTVPTVDQGEEVAAWLKQVLELKAEEECSLVKMVDTYKRPVDVTFGEENDEVSLADGYALLLTSEGSLEELNKIQGPNATPMNRFRTNIVIKGPAYFEDRLRKIKIGDVLFKVCKPCLRCSITLKDQETGEKDKEPLKSLSTTRRGQLSTGDKGVVFGQNLIPLNKGTIQVGDRIEILELADEPNFIPLNK